MARFALPGTNGDFRTEVVRRLHAIPECRQRFGEVPTPTPRSMPCPRKRAAMTMAEKRGALQFFGDGKCVSCHAVRGKSNEMFSDFDEYVIDVPQIVPLVGNVTFDGRCSHWTTGCESPLRGSTNRKVLT